MTNRIRNVCKRLVMLLSIAVLLSCFVASTGYADALYEWNRSCRRKTICETQIYADDFIRVTATIPANTYVNVHLGSTEQWYYIGYYTSSGQRGGGWAKAECIGSAVISFTDAEGYRQGIQELQYYEMYGNNPPPGGVLDKPLPGGNGETVGAPIGGTDNTEDNNTTEKETTSSSTTSTNTSKKNNTTKTSNAKTATSDVNTDVLWQGGKVTVKQWGFYSSVIVADGQEQTALNTELEFSEKVGTAKRIAYIHAPRTGRCYLRAKGSDKGDILDKCPAGTIVQVIEYGKSYCQIVFEGQVGYVQTACLKFANPTAEPMCTWQLSYQGKMTGSAQVPIRNSADNDSSIVVKLRSGTEVTVFAKSGSWYEVEYEGIHGFVHKSFLVMDE